MKNINKAPRWKLWLGFVLLFVLMRLAIGYFSTPPPAQTEVPLNEFISNVIISEGLDSVVIKQSPGIIEATFSEGVFWSDSDGNEFVIVTTSYTRGYEGTLTELLLEKKINFEVENDVGGSLVEMFLWLSPIVIILGVLYLIWFRPMLKQIGRQTQFGQTKNKVLVEKPKTKFSDVAGLEETKEKLQEVKEFLENPKKFRDFGDLMIPKGVLLYGPPGNGKTLLARAVAGEAGVPFFNISGSDFVEMFVGVGASRVRNLFDKAKEASPSILFIDEIDAVGRHRGAGVGGGNDEREQTLNQLLVELDGFDQRANVIIMAATNRTDILDDALTRPGRFDRQIMVPAPNPREREEILRLYARSLPVAEDIDFKKIAHQAYGMSGAGLKNIMNEAGFIAIRRNKTEISMSEIEEAIVEIALGSESKSFILEDRDKEVVAYHEAGHAIVAYALKDADPLHRVTIVPRGRTGGYTMTLPEKEPVFGYRNSFWARLAMTMGGRAAEDILSDNPSTGIASDNMAATQIAEKMVKSFGMSKLGLRNFGDSGGPMLLGRDFASRASYSDAKAREIDNEVDRLISVAYKNAQTILREYQEELILLAQGLINSENETLESKEVDEIFENTRLVQHKKKWKFDTQTGSATAPF